MPKQNLHQPRIISSNVWSSLIKEEDRCNYVGIWGNRKHHRQIYWWSWIRRWQIISAKTNESNHQPSKINPDRKTNKFSQQRYQTPVPQSKEGHIFRVNKWYLQNQCGFRSWSTQRSQFFISTEKFQQNICRYHQRHHVGDWKNETCKRFDLPSRRSGSSSRMALYSD